MRVKGGADVDPTRQAEQRTGSPVFCVRGLTGGVASTYRKVGGSLDRAEIGDRYQAPGLRSGGVVVPWLHFTDALATSERIGAPPHVARTSADYARMLLARGDAGDPERAHALLTQARSIAERIGQSGVLADVVGLVEQRAEA